jgi:hypothetical protein
MLADAGFDVWMANFRGANHYGRRHVNKKETDPSFWEWRFAYYSYFVAFLKRLHHMENEDL